MVYKFSTKKLNKLTHNLSNDKTLIFYNSYKKNVRGINLYMYYHLCISTDIFISNSEFNNNITNDYIKQYHNICKQFKSELHYITAKQKYKERTNIFIYKNKVCVDIQNVILGL